ncbi:TonB-dependent hemoglobin/transferrin/lactoferrin family receptor [Bradyrhizobium cenepequi]|uniref:TonB-dependent hemoglobin/transferrin/lactoferrin family receptor n=1 Tax=Bradyrhizobium cenepequi TaxID=2821403 RepID=UPI001CE3586C|nr:TonB-dependent hemoglobin/transferrin/lactoferrin family receptor [Bradyrhizobium cenepequi]MCA6109943.1 TonB-dependent hemoglobin/transferrin/lactoferrin family receptor [Bradyrhizobium cenepequi]
MADGARISRVLILGASVVSIGLLLSESGVAQTADAQPAGRASERAKQAKRKPAKPKGEQEAAAPVMNARAQIGAVTVQSLDTITVAASKTEERAIDALAPVSVVTLEQIQGLQPNRLSDIFYNVPGVSFQERGDDPSTVINIRGLQDFGRVAVVVDGARQNYQRTGHNANGSFFLDPELVGGVDVVRGPTANIYGSGAIGGVVSFRTKDIQDVVRPGERWGVDMTGSYGTNKDRGLGSIFGGVRVNPDVDVFGGALYRTQANYKDGNGTEIGNTGNEIAGGLMKLTVRPADGHEVKLGGIFQDYQYSIGQENRGPTTTAAPLATIAGSSVYASDVKNYTGTLTWKYSRPEDMLWDWNFSLYGNRTDNDQIKTYNNRITTGGGVCTLANPGNNISGCVGDRRSYVLDTIGVDVNNTTRFNFGDWSNALTYGFDAFQDDVTTSDGRGNSNITTPGGLRTVSGGFAQLRNNYSTWLEVISAIRYDRYDLHSATAGVNSGGDRFSPKITVGVTPVVGFTPYVSYAEGYRAPSITETLIAGGHATGGGPALFVCPDGTSGLFCFLPNPGLRPEVGKNKEVGVNLKYDGIFTAADSFRGKINVFRNDVSDYIDLVPSTPVRVPPFGSFSQFYQYQNIAQARIEGVEFETLYDTGLWYLGIAGHVMRGKNLQNNVGLATITPTKVTTTAGVRLLDRTLILAVQWASFSANNDLPAGYLPSTAYDLVNLYLTWNATKDITFTASVDNLLNQYYRPYAIPGSSTDGTTQNDVLFSSPGPGTVYKAGLKIHFGGA